MAPKLTLTLWVHDNARDGSSAAPSSSYAYGVPLASHLFNEVILNPDLLRGESPELKEGDVVELVKASSATSSAGSAPTTATSAVPGSASRSNHDERDTARSDTLMFIICKQSIAPEGGSSQLQISISQNLAQAFGLKNRDQIVLTKLPSPLPKEYVADHVELYFKDQYLGRADMHRISLALADSCIYKDQKVQLAGLNVRARIGGIWVQGKQRNSALVTSDTRTVFRSESAKYYIFLQLSKEMWHFDDDGSLFFEKALDLFLPELFSRWSKRSTNHIVSVVLFARIMYDKDETGTVQRPTMRYADQSPDAGSWTDMYKVIVDLENLMSWKNVLYLLRRDIQEFREQVYLASRPRPDERLAGSISWAHEGGILEAVNMALSAFNKHYIDRDLQRTGLSIVIITAGTAHFNVDKNLLRLTTERMIDEGFGVDLVSLSKMPLHAVPLFRYDGTVPAKDEGASVDLLYAEDNATQPKERLYAIPHWVDSSFYAKHQDKPFRCDRFLPRCRMSSIQSMGIADYENASISLPLINDELKLLEGSGPEWEQLSEIEKKRKTWERFDAIACGSLGKWEKIHQDEQKNQYTSRMKGHTERNGRNSDISLLGTSASDHSSDNEMAKRRRESSDISGSGVTNSDSTDTALAFVPRGREDRGRPQVSRLGQSGAATNGVNSAACQHRATPMRIASASPANASSSRSKSRSGRSASRPAAGVPTRSRADSSASSVTLFKRPSHLSLRSPSVVVATTARDLLADGKVRPSATPLEGRSDSHASQASITTDKVAPTTSASAALSSLMAAQNKKESNSAGTSTFAGGWFWNRKKAAASSPAKSSVPLPSPHFSRDPAIENPSIASVSNQASSESPPASVVSRKSSLLSMSKPATSLSITPATPSTATTATASTTSQVASHRPSIQTAQPISMAAATPAAFTIATNDILCDPRSLDEHSIQQHFFEAARQAGLSTRTLKSRIEMEKKKRVTRLNPSNPSRSSAMLQNQSRRWINIFPRAGRINNQRSVKWKSLCTPACLPLYTDYMPSIEDLSDSYTKNTYSLPVTAQMGSFLLKPGKDVNETAGNLLRELVNQRLAQSFQIIMPTYEDLARRSNDHSRRKSDSGFILPSAADIREILYNTSRGEGQSIFLGFSTVVHKLRFDRASASIVVTSWSQKKEWSTKPFDYKFMLMPFGATSYSPRPVTFSYPNLNTYDWQYMDRLVAGMEAPKLQEKTRYWRTRFILLPAEVPDLKAMIQSQSKVLLEDSTEDDLRIAGVMTLYELFSKAMWQPPNKARFKSTLVYTTTTYDPSIYAAEEVERLTSESGIVPQPDAYTEDKFFEDLSAEQIVQAMLDGPRPVRLQARRSGFRKIGDSFTGQDFVSWLVEEFVDVPDRATGLIVGNELIQGGVIDPIVPPKRLLDSYTFYQVAEKYRPQTTQKDKSKGWSSSILGSESLPTVSKIPMSSSLQASNEQYLTPEVSVLKHTSDGRIIFPMSNCTIVNLDPQHKSDRSETAFLHLDVAHNPSNGFHFQLNWLGTSRLVDDMLSHWQRMAEKHGLRLVEENVRQIKDISYDNPLQAAARIRLALPPPSLPNLAELLGTGNVQNAYFQTQLLRDLGYILDVEADANFPSNIQAEYSYSKEEFHSSQFIHKSGTCFVQILDDEEGPGFLLLRNRLYLSHRQINWSAKTSISASAAASDPGELKRQLQEICDNAEELAARWADIEARLTSGESTAAGSGSVKSGSTARPAEDTPADLPLPLSFPESLPSLAESNEEDE